MNSPFPFEDVDTKAELPDPPADCRYLDFIGGDKELRCFLVPREMPRTKFLREHADHLDVALRPIYDHRGVSVRQDCSYALPGFYIVSYAADYTALDKAPWDMHVQLSTVLYETRRAMRVALGLEHIHLYYEEKDEPSCRVHYWLLPIPSRQGSTETLLTHLDLHSYLHSFTFREHKAAILGFNERMRAAFRSRGLEARQEAARRGVLLASGLEDIQSVEPGEEGGP